MRQWLLVPSVLWLAFASLCQPVSAHPLKLSLSQIEYTDESELLKLSLRLFLTDVNEALVFDPDNYELALGQPDEAPRAEMLLLGYLNEAFYLRVNDELVELEIKSKELSGEGINLALVVDFEFRVPPPINTIEIKNAVFMDLFPDQSNIVYVHVNGGNQGLRLTKQTQQHTFRF